MSSSFGRVKTIVRSAVCALAIVALSGSMVFGQGQGNFFQTVGGIKIDASGVLSMTTEEFKSQLHDELKKQLDEIDPVVNAKADLRMISVKAIEAALREAADNGTEIADEIKFMAGIQRLEYVFVYPDKNDIVLAGVGEGWVVNDNGEVVGKTTGNPVIHLEDFLVAMQTVDNARRDLGIGVSIDPTEEGLRSFQSYMRRAGTFNERVISGAEQSMGDQTITVNGVPTNSRYAQVLVAADHRMKRMAMGFQEATRKDMPSILEIAQKRRKALNISPRFWLECNYDSVKKSDDGMSWQITGPGAKALTEEEALMGGEKGRSNPVATQWAESMTEQFSDLANDDAVFTELRNVMDMSVFAALIRKEKLAEAAGLELPLIMGKEAGVEFPEWNSPATVPTQCSYCRVGSEYMITASGGISVDSWGVVENVESDNSLADTRALAASAQADNAAFWNGN